ncbi:MAG: hypothetical protein AB2421_03085 [Thermotaleaceae bacterium]
MKDKQRWIFGGIALLILGNLLGAMLTIGWLNYKLKKDGPQIMREFIVREQDIILEELGKALEGEINRIIEKKQYEITGEVQRMIEILLESKSQQLQRQLEKAVDDYIKRKLKSLIPIP